MARLLVTGAAGFIGSHTVARLLAERHAVTALDNLSSGVWANLEGMRGDLSCVEADIRDAARLREIVLSGRYHAVIHLAALASVVASVERPDETNGVNVTGTLNLLEAVRGTGARRVVVASSTAVYGRTPPLPTAEDYPPAPASPYAASKAAAEMLCMAYRESFGLETVILRYFNVYGPRQPADSPYSGVVAAFARRVAGGEPITIHGDGRQTRDFVHVSDIAAINLLAACGADPGGRPINAGSGTETSILEVVDGLQDALGRRASVAFCPGRPADVCRSRADIHRLRNVLGYEPVVTLGNGLRSLLL